jgi:thioredoxin 1
MSSPSYRPESLTRQQVDAMAGAVLLDFGTEWCGHCRAARPLVEAALQAHPGVQHLRVEDGSGRRLGRSFGVKLWPTLVFLRDGREVARLVRPRLQPDVAQALAAITIDLADTDTDTDTHTIEPPAAG